MLCEILVRIIRNDATLNEYLKIIDDALEVFLVVLGNIEI